MPNKILTTLILAAAIVSLGGDELNDKLKQLEKLKKDLEKTEQKIEQTEKKKTQNQTKIQSAQTTKTKTSTELKKSQAEEKMKRDVLNVVTSELRSVEQQIADLNKQQNAQIIYLMKADNARSYNKVNTPGQYYVAKMSTQTREKLNNLGVVQSGLTIERRLKSNEHSKVLKDVQTKSSTIQKLDRDVRNLEGENKKLTKEQQKLQDQVAKLRNDAAQLESLIASLTSRSEGEEPASYKFSARTIAWPLRGKIIRGYGQETRSYGTSVVNNGIDIAAAEWTNVVAADNGEVVFSGSYGGQGKLIIIDHKNGFFTVYAYNNELKVSKGATVKKGQVIAKSGMTGSASQPSLHFEVRKDGKAVNPLSYLE